MSLRLTRCAIAVSLVVSVLFGQQPNAPPYLLIPDQNMVYVMLAAVPRELEGFTVSRRDPGSTEFKLLTPQAVSPVQDPMQARALLGEAEYAWLSSVLETENEFALLQRLKSDRGAGGALSLVSQRVALVTGRLFIDTLVQTGRRYVYRITFLDYRGRTLATHDREVTVTVHSPPRLGISGLVAEPGDSIVKLRWYYPPWRGDESDITVGFYVFRREEGETEFTKLTPRGYLRTSDSMLYQDEAVVNDQTYEYCLSSFDIIGAESPRSAIVRAMPQDTMGPKPPIQVECTNLVDRVHVTWQPVQDLGKLSGFNVYRAYTLLGKYQKLNPELIPASIQTFNDDSAIGGKLQVYRVSAVDRKGREGRLSVAGFGNPTDLTAPPPPGGLAARAENRMVKISWTPTETRDLAGYYVYRSLSKSGFLRLGGPRIPSEQHELVDSGPGGKGLLPGTTYYYTVAQIDLAGNEGIAETVGITIPDDDPPLPPSHIGWRMTNEGIPHISWVTSLSRDLARYRVLRFGPDRDTTVVCEVGPETYECFDSTAQKGQKYSYLVVAIDRAGNQSRTKTCEAVPRDIYAPAAPRDLKLAYDRVKRQVTLTWRPVVANDLVGYNVYRSDRSDGTYTRLGPAGSFTTGQTAYTDSNLVGGSTFFYKVSAVTGRGEGA
ncbi:MAG: hypothetical protein ABIK62_05650, partial [candidate division WOR-3 bacterium]